MFKIIFKGNEDSVVRYVNEAWAWRAVHEILEEAFGDNYDATDLAEYDVVKVAQ